jgi:hypothetical protein
VLRVFIFTELGDNGAGKESPMNISGSFRADAPSAWDRRRAAHLLNRAGFGALPADIEQAVRWGMERTVDYLIEFEQLEDSFPPPEMPENPRDLREIRRLSEEERRQKFRELMRANREAIEEIRGWWIRRMLQTKRPLQEKMTLFWHGHFATSANDIRNARHMLKQNQFLRENCLGNFRALLLGISRDPAMLKYLDNNTNRKRRPNENYARELLELFTMGIGNYTEDDVKNAARAFTGWTFRGDEFVFQSRQHDFGPKTFLGEHGNFDGADIVDIILKQPVTARFIGKKLLEFFVHENPDPQLLDKLAALLRENDYEIKPFLRALFTSEAFYSAKTYRAQIKSPAELVIGSVRYLGATVNERALAVAMRSLGQDLLYPPNVAGWQGGEAWINTNTILMRYNLAGYLVAGKNPEGGRPARGQPQQRRQRLERFGAPKNELDKMFGPDISANASRLVAAMTTYFLQTQLDDAARQWLMEQAERTRVSERPQLIAHLIMSMPDYQLC